MAISSGRVTANEKVSFIGLELPKGESIKIELGPEEEIYAITDSGDADITYLLTKNE